MDRRSALCHRVRPPASLRPPLPCRAAPAARAPPGRATSPVGPLRCGLPDGRVVPSPSRQLQCSLRARCDAPRARTAVWRATAGASASRPVGCNEDHGVTESRKVAAGPGGVCARLPDAPAPNRGSPHVSRRGPTPASVHQRDAASEVDRISSIGLDRLARAAGDQQGSDHNAVVLQRCQLSLNAIIARSGFIAEPQLGSRPIALIPTRRLWRPRSSLTGCRTRRGAVVPLTRRNFCRPHRISGGRCHTVTRRFWRIPWPPDGPIPAASIGQPLND